MPLGISNTIKTLAIVFLAVLLPPLCPAQAIEERWHVDLYSGSRAFPLAVDYDKDSRRELFFTTRFDGTVWVVASTGNIVASSTRAQWLEGSIAASGAFEDSGPFFAFQESTGRLNVSSLRGQEPLTLDLPGEPCIGTTPCIADINYSGRQEIICTNRDGLVTALNRRLNPVWQYDAGAPVDSSVACAPIFRDAAAIYVQTTDGRLHCIHGSGRPLWRYRMDQPAPSFPEMADPLLVELQRGVPSALISDRTGSLYAVDAATGTLQWRVQAASAALGSPAIADVVESPGVEIVLVSAIGELAIVSAAGELLSRVRLPAGTYVPRPLVADVDADAQFEVLVAESDWRVYSLSLDGAVEQVIPLRGAAREGIVMADLEGDGTLELLAVTDCARMHVFSTRAKSGWTHPRVTGSNTGCVSPITPSIAPEPDGKRHKAPGRLTVTVPNLSRDVPFTTAIVGMHRSNAKLDGIVEIRTADRILGSAVAPLRSGILRVPFVNLRNASITMDLTIVEEDGRFKARYADIPVNPSIGAPVLLPPNDEFLDALSDRGRTYGVPDEWRLPDIEGKDSWTVATYMPEKWLSFGIADRPFVREAIPRINAPADKPQSLFTPAHPAWNATKESESPFFLMNGYFQPAGRYPDDAMETVIEMAGARFLGFPMHEWGYRVWKTDLEGAIWKPDSKEKATELARREVDRLMDTCHGMLYAGEGYCNFHHLAYAGGAPMCYAEIGENIPCAPLQFASLRGAARQFGNKPWGAYISNWFRASVLDARYRPEGDAIRWRSSDEVTGPDCGHSSSLEFRLAMAAHLSGATFVHHESDAHNGSVYVAEMEPGSFSISRHGEAFERWYNYSKAHPNRGTPYTPIAFLLDADNGWRPREPVYGIWPQGPPERSMEAVTRRIYPWGGRLDFERGYLANGPYGDIFDFLTTDAKQQTLDAYGAVWPLGDVRFSSKQRDDLIDYVEKGGVLVLHGKAARTFPTAFLGVRVGDRVSHATAIQSGLQATASLGAPYAYHEMTPGKDADALAWTESGDVVLTWRKVKKGIVIVTAIDHWIDVNGALVPTADAVLRSLADAFVPFSLPDGVESFVNATADGYVIGLINNNGVTKVPTLPPVFDPSETRECLIGFKGRSPNRFVSRMGEFRWIMPAAGLATTIGPGEVAVVEIFLR